MKRTLVGAALVAGFCVSIAAAAPEPSSLGLGFAVGEPTGLSGKEWTSGRTAFDAALAWSFSGYTAVHVHADALWHTSNMIHDDNGFLPLYVGIGGRLKLAGGEHNKLRAGARIPLGAEYVFVGTPVGLFLEVVPVFDLVPETGLDWNGAIGIRYYFGSQGG